MTCQNGGFRRYANGNHLGNGMGKPMGTFTHKNLHPFTCGLSNLQIHTAVPMGTTGTIPMMGNPQVCTYNGVEYNKHTFILSKLR